MKILFSLILICLLSGCGHNILTVSEGTFLNIGYDPNNSKVGVQYVDGSQITVVEKDNATLEVEKENVLDASGKITSKKYKIKYEIEEQITGSDTDMEKAKK